MCINAENLSMYQSKNFNPKLFDLYEEIYKQSLKVTLAFKKNVSKTESHFSVQTTLETENVALIVTNNTEMGNKTIAEMLQQLMKLKELPRIHIKPMCNCNNHCECEAANTTTFQANF